MYLAIYMMVAIVCIAATYKGTRTLRWYILKKTQHARRINHAYDELFAAIEHLEAWQEARPFLRVTQSAYSVALVETQIEALERIIRYQPDKSHTEGYQYLAILKELLERTPPRYPNCASSRKRACFFTDLDYSVPNASGGFFIKEPATM